MKRDLHFEMIYPNPPEEVWRALTDPEILAGWLMENNFAPRIGQKFQFRTKSRFGIDRVIECEVLEVDEPRILSYTWGGKGSVVTFRLDPIAEGTRLRLEHKGMHGIRGVAMAWILSRGWKHKINQRLPAVLAQRDLLESR